MSGQISARQSGECFPAVERSRRRSEPRRNRNIRVLVANHRPAPHLTAQARRKQQVHQRLPRRRDTSRVEPVAKLRSCLRALRRHRLRDQGDPALGLRDAHAFLPETPLVPGGQLRRRQGVEPPVVLRGDEVERAAVQPRDDQRPLGAERAVDVGRKQAR
jgi:hypothetical protein